MRTTSAFQARIALRASFVLLSLCATSLAQSPDPATPEDPPASQENSTPEPSTQEELNRVLELQASEAERAGIQTEEAAESGEVGESDSNVEEPPAKDGVQGELRPDATAEASDKDAKSDKQLAAAKTKKPVKAKVASAPADTSSSAKRSRFVLIAALLATLAAIAAMLQRHLKTLRAEDALLD